MRIRFHSQARESPQSIGGLAVPYAAAKRAAPKWRWYLILLTVASPVVILMLSLLGGFLTHSANGAVTLDQLEIRAIAGGRVHSVREIGSDVAADDVVATLADPRAVAGLNAQTAGGTAQRAGPSLEASAELALRARGLRLAQERRDSLAALLQARAATGAELREAEGALDQAAAALLQARRATAVDAAAARTASAPVVSNRSPTAGRVLDVYVSEGEIVAAGDPLVLVGRQTMPKVTAYVSPKFAAGIHAGARATVRFADGGSADAEIAEAARVTRRMPADLVDQFGMRPMMVVLKLRAATPWPAGQAIHGLPVRVRFHYDWESTAIGGVLTPLLDVMAGSP